MKHFLPGFLLMVWLSGIASVAIGETLNQRLELLERRLGKLPELTLQLSILQRDNRELRGEIESLQHQIRQLERKQRDIYLDMDQRLANMAGAGPVASPPAESSTDPAGVAAPMDERPSISVTDAPSVPENQPQEAPPETTTPPVIADPQKMQADYTAAYRLLSPSERRYEEAAVAFTEFLQKYPGSELAPNAQYWLAEAYYVSQRNDEALEAFRKVVNEYPSTPKLPGSLYKIGRLQKVKGNAAEAREALQRVVDEYPHSSAAGLARELLKSLP